MLPPEGLALASGYDFSGRKITFVNRSNGARRVTVDGSGTLAVGGPIGPIIMYR